MFSMAMTAWSAKVRTSSIYSLLKASTVCCTRGCAALKLRVRPRLNDNIASGAGDDSLDLGLLGLGHSELVKSLLKIVEKGFPFCCRDIRCWWESFIERPVYV
jgi:hypothetical protein